jgi:hypothetical protein
LWQGFGVSTSRYSADPIDAVAVALREPRIRRRELISTE